MISMKKIFFAAIMLVAAYTLSAQQTTVTYQATNSNAPMDITTHFSATHPGVTVTSWQSSGDYWYGTYKSENNRLIHV